MIKPTFTIFTESWYAPSNTLHLARQDDVEEEIILNESHYTDEGHDDGVTIEIIVEFGSLGRQPFMRMKFYQGDFEALTKWSSFFEALAERSKTAPKGVPAQPGEVPILKDEFVAMLLEHGFEDKTARDYPYDED